MQTTRKPARLYGVTPAVSAAIGLVYLIGFTIGGHPLDGLAGLGVMLLFGVGLAVAGRRSETVRGLLDRRDERITGIDLRATAFTAVVLIAAILAGFVVSVARGQSGWPYVLLGAIGGLAYVAAVIWFRVRT
ncbi:MAG: hypothetical protein ACM32E_20705 [Gemmatimonadota bacterium]